MTPRLELWASHDDGAEGWRILARCELISGIGAEEDEEILTVTGPAERGRRVRYRSRSAACSFDGFSAAHEGSQASI